MLQASEEDTVLLFRRLHNTARVFGNTVAKRAAAIEAEKGKDIKFEDIAELVAGSRGRAAERKNDPEDGIWSAGRFELCVVCRVLLLFFSCVLAFLIFTTRKQGQSVGLCDDIPTVDEFMKRFMKEAVDTVEQRLVSLVSKL